MIQILPNDVERYLRLVKDENPLHQHIVPGQMIVQIALIYNELNWKNYKINYVEPVDTYEFLHFDFESNNKLIVKNNCDKVKVTILKNK
ncbi:MULTISPECIES: hypothetical protein [Staphylococcus]|uniref:hypothetical protein n=1 Tax=Staphylococcus TaxID=1279 RepID=UPI0008A63883|nr:MULTISPECIES: hypothetical protein [Staphylococcus]PIS62897.1 hypothetical protein AZH47_01280 [Corynebacterium striatum]MDK7752423.1 hypothetical protein [Staphylococcus sp. UMB10092B]MDT3983362.1 hypothetical protein [Staphylococcus ureilyticus]OFQ87802.1 hypothetical protein HMPREF2913_02500 [Staphylococcus sp. HMSC065A08]OHO41847.1 hypothetical protein HMPREF2586_07990 [Staphylococcus sp. HMSC034G07]